MFPSVKPADVLATLGIGSVAIGFAFKDILQNWLSGLLILYRQPFRSGDQIKSGEFEGTVERIEARATLIKTYDGQRVVIPNSDIYTRAVMVRTAFPERRSEYDVGIGYGDDVEEACRVILDAMRQVEGVESDPAPEAFAWALDASSVNIKVRWWSDSQRASVVHVQGRVLSAVKRALSEAGIDLPFPTRVVLLHDQTEESDGDRTRQREGWPKGDSPPRPRHLNELRIERPRNGGSEEQEGASTNGGSRPPVDDGPDAGRPAPGPARLGSRRRHVSGGRRVHAVRFLDRPRTGRARRRARLRGPGRHPADLGQADADEAERLRPRRHRGARVDAGDRAAQQGCGALEGVMAMAVLVFLQFAITWASVRVPLHRRLIKSEPTLARASRRFPGRRLAAQRVTRQEVLSVLRGEGLCERGGGARPSSWRRTARSAWSRAARPKRERERWRMSLARPADKALDRARRPVSGLRLIPNQGDAYDDQHTKERPRSRRRWPQGDPAQERGRGRRRVAAGGAAAVAQGPARRGPVRLASRGADAAPDGRGDLRQATGERALPR